MAINWKTTLAGIFAFGVTAVPEILNYITANPAANWKMLLLGVIGLLAGLAAKDRNVTGGTVNQ